MVTLCNSCEQQESCKIFEIMGDSMPITHCKNYIQTRRETVRVKQTNADRIRGMSDEELADMLSKLKFTYNCNRLNTNEDAKEMLEWLKTEVPND